MTKISLKYCLSAACLVALLNSPVWAAPGADTCGEKVVTVNGQKQIVFSNSGNERFNNSVFNKSGVVKIKPARKSYAAPSYNNKVQMKYKSDGIRPDGSFDLPAPKITVIPAAPQATQYIPSYNSANWAFSTFDANKRQPRYITYYGWGIDNPGSSKTWHQVDLNGIILRHARRWNVDPLLVEVVIRHESNFNPTAVSPVGAIGLMQLMPDTAAGLGVTDPYDPDQNVYGGVRYIASQMQRFNDVRLALAAFNAGPGAVSYYGGVPPYAETQYYVDTIYGEYIQAKRQREARY